MVGLAVVRDLRERRARASPEELADFETDVLAAVVVFLVSPDTSFITGSTLDVDGAGCERRASRRDPRGAGEPGVALGPLRPAIRPGSSKAEHCRRTWSRPSGCSTRTVQTLPLQLEHLGPVTDSYDNPGARRDRTAAPPLT
jgi:hypothetical protein